ncbi:MAG TPA: ferritin-like domain-containing protein [Myxococcaceae bacterium]
MKWSDWRRHFELNRQRPLPEGLEHLEEVPQAWRKALGVSLATFQLGEAGEGRIAHEIDSASLPGIDADYRAALKLFVAEEGRHARILGFMVRGLGGKLLGRNWTERLFVFARRLLGLRLKLMVLLVAEVVGGAFYGLLASRLPEGALRRALEQICEDEEHHLDFHGDFFARQGWGVVGRAVWQAVWWSLALAAMGVVMVDHRRTLRTMGISLAEAVKAFIGLTREAASHVPLFPERPKSPLPLGEG